MRPPTTAALGLILAAALIGCGGPAKGPLVGFETGDFSQVEETEAKAGTLEVTRARAYDGTHSVRATFRGGGSGKERFWLPVRWGKGTDVWYGIAMYVPKNNRYCYWNPLRWDNYSQYQGRGDVGGLTVEQGRIEVIRGTYASRHEDELVDGGKLPTGRWVWVEVHQRFADKNGAALSELYLDGDRVGRSRRANFFGRNISHLRAGAVNVAEQCSPPGVVDFDRFSISDRERGPL